jgi:hypothetical protein
MRQKNTGKVVKYQCTFDKLMAMYKKEKLPQFDKLMAKYNKEKSTTNLLSVGTLPTT